MPTLRLAFTFALILLPMATALAQQAQDPWERVRRFDANQDDKISREEFRVFGQARGRRAEGIGSRFRAWH
jgi:hypothetical protein